MKLLAEKSKNEEKKSEKKSSKDISPVKQSKNSEKKDKIEVPSESPKNDALVNNDVENKAVKNERPKTVKRRQYTFRMTGEILVYYVREATFFLA